MAAKKLTGKKAGKAVKAKAKPKKTVKKTPKKAVKPASHPELERVEELEVDEGDMLEEEDFFGDDGEDSSLDHAEGDLNDE